MSDFLKEINEEAYCGITSWRLPTLAEMKTLIYKKNIKGKKLINPYIFPRATRTKYMTSDKAMVNGKLTITLIGFLNGKADFFRDSVLLNLDNSYLNLLGKKWGINDENKITISPKYIGF